ncbi:MAG: hypothetical protein SH818_00055, partial [Saprospiraceae bacterium]|nr:hypothetical protein [Saprospiraceae bacterium]
ICFLLALGCQPVPKNYLAHQWLGDGGKQIMVFDNDSTLQWIIHEELLSDTFLVRYKLNEGPDPDHLDLYGFTRGILAGKVLAGIVEMHTADSILLDFEPADSFEDVDSVRPKGFDPEQRRFFIRKK